MEKREPLCTVGGNVNAATMENSMEGPQKIKNYPISVYIGKDNKKGYQRDICTPMFTAALFTIAKTRK